MQVIYMYTYKHAKADAHEYIHAVYMYGYVTIC